MPRPQTLTLEPLEDRTMPSTPAVRPGFAFDGLASSESTTPFTPSPTIAVSRDFVVTAVGGILEWRTLPTPTSAAGAATRTSFGQFFGATNGGEFVSPRVMFDAVAQRFLFVVAENNAATTDSRIRLAVSDDADPNGNWYRFEIDADSDVPGPDFAAYLGVGCDEEAVYVTATQALFADGSPQDARLYIVDKGFAGGWYAGQIANHQRFDPDPTAHPPSQVFGIVPAHILGPPPTGATGTYLVSYNGLAGNGENEAVQIVRVDNPLGPSPTFTVNQVDVGDIDSDLGQPLPDAPQPGTPVEIETGPRWIGNAVWQDDRLFFATTVKPSSGADAGHATVHWLQVVTSTHVVERSGRAGGEDFAAGLVTYSPAVAVDEFGDLAVSFSGSGPSTPLTAFYAARLFREPTIRSTVALNPTPGDTYVRRPGNAGPVSPWGDSTGIAIAPNTRVFWTFQAYAETSDPDPPAGHDGGRWGAAAGAFSFNWPPDVDTPLPFGPLDFWEDSASVDLTLTDYFRDFETPMGSLQFSVVSNSNPGLVSASQIAADKVRLEFSANAHGEATIVVRAFDLGTADVVPTATHKGLLVRVASVNDLPTAGNDEFDGTEDTELVVEEADGILRNDSDPDAGDTLTAVLVSPPSHAQAFNLYPDGRFEYTPATDYTGTDSFLYRARDSSGDVSNVATVVMAVSPTNDPPLSAADQYELNEDGFLVFGAPGVLGNDSDPDSSALEAELVIGPAHAVDFVLRADGSFDYRPEADFFGTDTFTYRASDGLASSAAATVTLVVRPVQDPPIARDDVRSTFGPVRIAVLTNDTDADGDPLRVTGFTQPLRGRVRRTGADLVYTPNPGAGGPDAFTYTIDDGRGHTASATVRVTVADRIAPRVKSVRVDYGPESSVDLRTSTRAVLPWHDLTRIEVAFTEDVAVTAEALQVRGPDGLIPMAFQYDPIRATATWVVDPANELANGRYTVRLSRLAVADRAGNRLRADWAKAVGLLTGDVNGDGFVSAADTAAVRAAIGRTVPPYADLDGNGLVDAADEAVTRARLGKRLR